MMVQRLLFWLLVFPYPSSPNPTLVLSLPDHFCVGPDVIEVLWKLLIMTACLGACAFLIYLWRTILAVKPRQYEVTLDQIKMNIVELKKENKYLGTNIASWEEKIREAKKAQRKRAHKVSLAEINECKVQDELDDEVPRALSCENQELKEKEKFLEDRYSALSSQKIAKEAELNLLMKKVDMMVEFTEQQKRTAEEKLEETIKDLNETRNELSAAEDTLKATKEEMEKYRQQVEDMQHELSEAEFTFQGQIAVQERNAVANWMRARDWERRIVQQSRENAYLRHRLHMMEGEMLPVGPTWRGPMPGRPEFQKPLWQAPRPVPRMNSRTGPQKGPEMPTVGTGVRVIPPCPGPLRMPYHVGQNIPGFPPPPPPPHWGTWGPQPHLVPPPLGLPFHSEACAAPRDNSSAVPKKAPEENQANHFLI
ncbi:transport and Golgi organization protein 1 homolog isoform X1 [Mustela erminea]|uniref:transport and Golgi organization protein 1 homolog isoform X1 n=1 Tax=Mustela erminea TaxID=36723 RepID=UPI001386E4D9|nr:transport and Golgi organization protein 1 homolog isoform X1 [Mustela erminea]XP_032183380.1 transport and Golgi organization protein 1 homolog isoform X1 [Mustela erminea]XP_032183381.1 transport and Golgi organization protein 1 homolog isoform X1 [Mustela erminea]